MKEVFEFLENSLVEEDNIEQQYWLNRINKMRDFVEQDSSDPVVNSLLKLMEVAIEVGQCDNVLPENGDFVKVKRVIQVKKYLPKDFIKHCYKMEVFSVYGVGTYVVMDGIMSSESFRRSSKYDESLSPYKHAPVFNINDVSQDLRNEYDFRIAIPSLKGLFIPKKTNFTRDQISRASQLKFFDLTHEEGGICGKSTCI